MNMTYNNRPPMSYVPDVVLDENGQEHYGDSGSVVIGHTGSTIDPTTTINELTGEQQVQEQVVNPEEDLDAPEYQSLEVQMAEVSDEIHTTSVIPNDEIADQIASYKLGDSPADITVSYLSHKVYQGELTSEEAFQQAMNSGINPALLVDSYRRLRTHFSN